MDTQLFNKSTDMQLHDPINGFIEPRALYTLDAIKRRLGVKDANLRAARRAGLQVYYCHGRGYVLGHEWIRYVRSSVT